MTTDMFFVWLAAAVLVTLVFYFTRNWKGNYEQEAPPTVTTDREVILHRKIAKLQHECNEMQGVLLTYNNDYVRNEYWELQAQLQQAQIELQMKYGHSRKVPSFTRIK